MIYFTIIIYNTYLALSLKAMSFESDVVQCLVQLKGWGYNKSKQILQNIPNGSLTIPPVRNIIALEMTSLLADSNMLSRILTLNISEAKCIISE